MPRLRKKGARPAKKPVGPRVERNAGGSHRLPLTVSCPALLDGGSDLHFRQLVYDLLTIATRMEMLRSHLGRRMQMTGPQYSLLTAVASLQGNIGVGVGTVAQMLHVSSAFIASESGKLVGLGLLYKKTNQADRRGVLLSVSPAGRLRLDRLGDEIRAINDLFFGALDAKSFKALRAAAERLVDGSSKAVRHRAAIDESPSALLRAG